jgi:chemotaxis-related protein WspB
MLVLVFQVGTERYAIPCQKLVEVIPLVKLRTLAQSPPWLAGIFTLRGALVPVVDLCQLMLGTPCPDRLSSRIMLARIGERMVGLLAEQVTEAMSVKGRRAAVAVPGTPYLGDMLLGGEDTMVQLLDVDKLLPETMQQMLLVGAAG